MADFRAKPVSSLLSAFFDRETMRKGGAYIDFLDAWTKIVGVRLADHTRPVDVEKGILLVEADHSGWIQLLQMRQADVLDAVRRAYPELGVRTMAMRLAEGDGIRAREPGSAARDSARPDPAVEGPAAVNGDSSGRAESGGADTGRAKPAGAEQAEAAPAGNAPAADVPPALKAVMERIRRNLRED